MLTLFSYFPFSWDSNSQNSSLLGQREHHLPVDIAFFLLLTIPFSINNTGLQDPILLYNCGTVNSKSPD